MDGLGKSEGLGEGIGGGGSDDVGCVIMGCHFGKIVFFITCLEGTHGVRGYETDSYNFIIVFASI